MISYQVSTEISEPEWGKLDLRHYDREKLKLVAYSCGVLYWNCGGNRVKIPNAVLTNALSVIKDWEALQARHPEVLIPESIYFIQIEQTIMSGLSESSSLPHLPLHRPEPSPPESTASD